MNTHIQKARAAGLLPRTLTDRCIIGLVICAAGFGLLLVSLVDHVVNTAPNMRAALIGGGTAAAATAVGTLPILFSQNFSKRTYDRFLGFAAGVMLGATAFSLIMPALASAKGAGAGPWMASGLVGSGVVVGAALLLLLDRVVSADAVLAGGDVLDRHSLKRAWLFVWAVALHNLPEGLAIGVAYAGIDFEKANSLAAGISIQDVPEGMVVALALRSVGYGRLLSVALGMASGVIEPVAAAVGVALIGISAGLLPIALAGAAGAMLFVIVNDVIPEAHKHGYGTSASVALVGGFILMTVLDTAMA
jgi:ZIP family zinc transporter